VGARVRVGIVSWNTAELLDRCLAALPAALGGRDAEVVVVDNASADGSAEVVRSHAGVRLIGNPDNRGYARAMNQALTHAPGGAGTLIALNPDTEPPAGSLDSLVGFLDHRPDVGLVVPRLLNADGTEQHSVHRFPSVALEAVRLAPARLRRGPLGRRWWLERHSDHRVVADVDWAIGAVHVIRTEALGGQAPYDERWFMYTEDMDLCWRVRRRGWRVVLDGEVAVPHLHNAAGAQAWGAQRAARFAATNYDWYRRVHGEAAARRWGATKAAGSAVKLAAGAVLRLARPSSAEGHRIVSLQRGLLPIHLREAIGRSALPPDPPGPDASPGAFAPTASEPED